LAIKKQGGDLILYRALRGYRGQAKFTENLLASPFNKDLSNEATFSLIHLD
jgi:hypothetical protein